MTGASAAATAAVTPCSPARGSQGAGGDRGDDVAVGVGVRRDSLGTHALRPRPTDARPPAGRCGCAQHDDARAAGRAAGQARTAGDHRLRRAVVRRLQRRAEPGRAARRRRYRGDAGQRRPDHDRAGRDGGSARASLVVAARRARRRVRRRGRDRDQLGASSRRPERRAAVRPCRSRLHDRGGCRETGARARSRRRRHVGGVPSRRRGMPAFCAGAGLRTA